MAHPAFLVEQLVCQFLNQWHVGLQPKLHLSARSNGAITVNYNLTASLPVPQFEEGVRDPVGPSHTSRNGSRRVKIFYLVDILSDPFVLSFTSLHLKGLPASAVSSCLHLGPL